MNIMIKGGVNMFLAGLIIGATFGFAIMAILSVSGRSDNNGKN